MYQYKAHVVRVVDGDTVDLAVDLGFNIIQTGKYRLYGPDPRKPWGMDAPELSTPEGQAAKAYLQTILQVGFEVMVETIKDRKEKFGRWLAVVHLCDGTGRNANDEMVKAGHAVLKAY